MGGKIPKADSRIFESCGRGSFRGGICAARGRTRHNKTAARIRRARDREVTCSHANDNAVERSGLVSTIGERPRISACARPSKCTHLRTLRHPAAFSLHSRASKDTARLCDLRAKPSRMLLFIRLRSRARVATLEIVKPRPPADYFNPDRIVIAYAAGVMGAR